jgi:NAD+ synthase
VRPDDDAASALLEIDEERAVRALTDHLQDLLARHPARGVIMGLSGGLDSAVLASLAARALGTDSVHAVYIYDRDNERGHGSRAGLVAQWLGIDLEFESIESQWEGSRGRPPLAVRMARVSPRLNRQAFRVYSTLAEEGPFKASLRAGKLLDAGEDPGVLLRTVNRVADAVFYSRHRLRRRVLEEKAEAAGLLIIGGANRTEWEVGWFVRDGVDDLPHQPLIGLYKTQVRQLARYLGVPVEVRDQAPSADMMMGISDEFALGMSYGELDVALECFAGGLSLEEAAGVGVTERHLLEVRMMRELSKWKRGELAEPLPPDGGHGGGLRAARR